MMFIDTGAWSAAYVKTDPAHAAVAPLLDNATTRLITTDFVLAEALNLMRARNEFDRAVILGNDLFTAAATELIYLTPVDLQKAFVNFSTYRDQGWSFTDCTSLVAMQRLDISSAISLDRHFRQMPGITVYP